MFFIIEKPNDKLANDYTRAPENAKDDKVEFEWKKRRNDEAVRIFLRNNPSGRAVPKNR